jgi:hypothetical protein
MRAAILVAALAMILGLGAAVIVDLVRTGPTPLGLATVLVVALFAFGVVGALRHPPPDE